MKKNILLALSFFLLLTGCGETTSSTSSSISSVEESVYTQQGRTFDLGNKSIHTEKQQQALDGECTAINAVAYGNKELSLPNPITIDFSETYSDAEQTYYAFISTDNTFSNPTIKEIKGTSIDLYNVYLQQDYYVAFSEDKAALPKNQDVYHFFTSDTIVRNMNVDGVTNVRDFAYWPLTNGKKLKTGNLYRGATLNTSKSDTMYLEVSQDGLNTLINDMKIKTEVDVRMNKTDNNYNENGAMTNDVIPEIEYYNIPWNYKSFTDLLTDDRDPYEAIFDKLADSSNYPMYFHCSHGADRTGVIFFILGALVGMDETSLYQDYLFTNFGKIGSVRNPDTIETYLNDLNALEGDTLSDKAKTFLLSRNISEETINKVINNLIQ